MSWKGARNLKYTLYLLNNYQGLRLISIKANYFVLEKLRKEVVTIQLYIG